MQYLKLIKKLYLTNILILFFLSCKQDKGNRIFYLDEYTSHDFGLNSIIYESNQENYFKKILVYPTILKVYESNDFYIVFQKTNSKYLLNDIKLKVEASINQNKNYYINFPHGTIETKKIKELYNSKNKSLDSTTFYIFDHEKFYINLLKNDTNYYSINKINRESKLFNNYLELKKWLFKNNLKLTNFDKIK